MKIIRKERGITLVALIITIIVLLILAVVSIRAVTGDGIIEYAKNARQEYTQAQTNEQAQIQSYLYELEEGLDKPIKHSGIIPTGGVYTLTDGTVLNAGQSFPDTVTDGDIYVYGDYEYHYNYEYHNYNDIKWELDTTQNGWGVRVLDDTKANYGQIIESINGKNITKLRETFCACKQLKTALPIPRTVVDMSWIFRECEKLTDISSLNISDSTIDIHGAFYLCSSLMDISTFVIPESVTRIDSLFQECDALIDASSLVIPSSVVKTNSAFYGCDSLTTAPEIPASVENTDTLFWRCISLRGNVVIDANPTTYSNMFGNVDMSNINLIGSSSMLELMGATGLNYSSN